MAGRKRADPTRQGEGMNVEQTRQAGSREQGMRPERGIEQTRQAGGREHTRQDRPPRPAQPRREENPGRTTREEGRGIEPERGSVERGGMRGGSSALEFEDQDVDLSDRGGIQRTGRRPSEQHDRTQDRTVDRDRM